ncbi:MAG: hypothetical protein MJZ97_06320 [Bacteroidales bacterium]|nr:hypothetical protein [Bacteroidales bacterium]
MTFARLGGLCIYLSGNSHDHTSGYEVRYFYVKKQLNMFEKLLNRLKDWFSDRNERMELIRDFNKSARNAFVSGIAPTLLKADMSRGCSDYKHRFSAWPNSGFRITAFSGRQLTKNELISIGNTIIDDDMLVRRLVVLGWDTLEVQGDQGQYGCRWQLKDYLLIGG